MLNALICQSLNIWQSFSCVLMTDDYIFNNYSIMRTETGFSEVPGLIAAFAPEYKQEHYHLHGRKIDNWESFKSIFLDEHYEVHKFAVKVLKGAALGFLNGFLLRNILFRGPKRFELDRFYVLNKSAPFTTPLRGYTALGAVYGATWWLIKDAICMPHGQDTLGRYLLANALMGGVLFATIIHPINFIYGCAAGALYGGLMTSIHSKAYPRNFELHITSADPEQRRKLLREDEQYQLSQRNSINLAINHYPL